jgi:ribosomal-protein-alanine N-acetyltransferase
MTESPAVNCAPVVTSDWQSRLPLLHAGTVTLRELRLSDAPALHELLTTEEVARFISPPPTTVAGFERFIEWTHRERAAGRYACFAVVPDGLNAAVGIFQIRQLGLGFDVSEWGFALGQAFWGTGVFTASAQAVLAFAFETLGVTRMEARCAVPNGRGNGALQKIGAFREATLRKAFVKDGVAYDQVLWSIDGDEWRERQAVVPRPRLH